MYMGYDQYGNHYSIKKYPRKELCEQIGRKSANKMYVDRPDGSYHVGYIIAGCWITVFGLEGVVFAKREFRPSNPYISPDDIELNTQTALQFQRDRHQDDVAPA